MLREYRLDITTDALGAATVTAPSAAYGSLYAVKFAIGTLTAGAVNVTLSYLSSDGVTVPLLTLATIAGDALYYPREQVHGNTKTGLTLDGTEIAFDQPAVAGRLRAAVTDGGDTLSGVLLVYVERED